MTTVGMKYDTRMGYFNVRTMVNSQIENKGEASINYTMLCTRGGRHR